jgi:ferredoxin
MKNASQKNVNTLFVESAGTFAEAICASGGAATQTNLFGRKVAIDGSGDLNKLLGLSATGVRTAACIAADNIKKSLDTLAAFKRMHIPFTLAVEGNGIGYLAQLAQTGSIVFQVDSHQAFSDHVLIAQVISEKALMPVVILADLPPTEENVVLADRKILVHWFGDPDGRVPDPTPAQTLTMGAMRRRMPGWIQTDQPAFVGAQKNHRDKIFEVAAQAQFEHSHVQQMIAETLVDFGKHTGRTYAPYRFMGAEKPKFGVVSTARYFKGVHGLMAGQPFSKKRISVVGLSQLYPVPEIEEWQDMRPDRLLVLEAAQYQPLQGWLKKEFPFNLPTQNGWYATEPTEEQWKAALENLIADRNARTNYWLDVPFVHEKSAYPKHEVLLAQINRDYPEVEKATLANANRLAAPAAKIIPAAAKQYAGHGAPYTRLNRFFDDVACLYDQPDELVADPFQANPVLPLATAVFNKPPKRQQIPQFDSTKANDVETYATVCPHGALPTSLFNLADLIKSGIAAARGRGETISLLVPLSKVWAKNAAAIAIAQKGKVKLAKDILVPAFEKSLPMAKKDPEATKAEYEQVMMGIGEIPIAITDTYFVELEKAKPGTGELFSLAIDPSACSGCGLCAETSNDGAMKMEDYTDQLDANQLSEFNRFDVLPETSPATIKRLLADKDFDPYAALLLNKSYYRTFAGNGVNWMYAAESNILHMVLAQAEYTLASNHDDIAKELSKKSAGINNAIKKVLSDALPVTNLDALMDVVHEHSEEKLSMDQIFKEWGKEQSFKPVVKDELESKLELIEGLKQLKWALKEGLNECGRSKYSIVIDQSLEYAARYPWNGFNVPVLYAEAGSTASVALGVFEGELRNALDNIRLLRRADLEALGKYKHEIHDEEIVNLSWKDLTEEELKLVTPVILLASQRILTNGNMNQLQDMLAKGYPIKVIILEEGTINPYNPADVAGRTNAFWPLIAQGKASVGRSSLANPKQLFELIEAQLSSPRSAVLSVFTPNAFAYDINPAHWSHMCKLAESSRTFIPLRFTPGEAETVAGQMQVGIENVNDDWNTTELVYRDGELEKTLAYKLTFADYAFLLKEWKPFFEKMDNAAKASSMADYLELDETAANTKIPAIIRVDGDGKLVHYAVDSVVVEACKAVRNNFRLVREWAGLFTAFPEKLKQQVDEELRKEYEAEKKKLVAELAAEKKTWETDHLEKLKEQVKERLMKMAGHL